MISGDRISWLFYDLSFQVKIKKRNGDAARFSLGKCVFYSCL